MAMIAGLPKAPSRYNPLVNPTRSTERRNWILERMLKLGFIDQQRYQAAVEEPINASYHVQTPELNAPYIAEMARAEMVGRYGSEAYTEGYKVITTVRSDLQNAASQSVRDGSSTMTSATATAARRPACRARPATPGSSTWASSAASAAWSRRSSPRWKRAGSW